MDAQPANLTQLNVPYPALLAEYQDRVGALTNEVVMLRATIAHIQRTAAAPTPPPAEPSVPANDAPPLPDRTEG